MTSWFDLLPTETIIQIFILASHWDDVRSLRSNGAFPSAALRVDRQWRNIAQATPSIWMNPAIIAHENAGQRLKEHLKYGPPNQITHLDVLVPALNGTTRNTQMSSRLFSAVHALSQDTRCLRSIRFVAREGASTVSIVYVHEVLSQAWGDTLERLEMVGCHVLTEAGQTVEEGPPFASGLGWYGHLRFLSLENVSPGGLQIPEGLVRRYCLPDLEELHLTKADSTMLVLISYFSMPRLYILAIDCSNGSSSESTTLAHNGGLAAHGSVYIRAQYIILYNIPSSADIRKLVRHAFRAQYIALTFEDSHDFETDLLPTLSSRSLRALSFCSRHPSLKHIKRIVESQLPRLQTIELDRSATLNADNEDLQWLNANARLKLRSEDELEFDEVLRRVNGWRQLAA